MHRTFQRTLTTGTIVAAAAAAGVIVAAPSASAEVADGFYTSNAGFLGLPYRSDVGVNDGTLTLFGPFGAHHYPITDTASGGHITSFGTRYTLNRNSSGGYDGPVTVGPFTIGRSTLTPS
ncbi:MAG: hypothetical protein QM774_10580 [Gordonia sp. (in: high G+C Gram-positive bacteria)]|uniref:hypothetical protein n=1 Tax=Gordonia sp. (in: high G+C Gram-positive bacteria) TaxID=84139 RepID=UPI0039E3DB00